MNTDILARNVKVIAEALARQVFNLSPGGQHEIFTEGLVSKRFNLSAFLMLNNLVIMLHDSIIGPSVNRIV